MREISILKERILQYLDYKGVNKKKFYKDTGSSNGILSQNNGLSEDNLMRFLNFYNDVNPSWLLSGQGDMIKKEFQNPDTGKTISEENLTLSKGKIKGKEKGKKRNINKNLPFQEKEPSPPDHSLNEIIQLLKENKKLVEEKNELLANENKRLNNEVSRLTAANSLLSTENANLQAQNKDLAMQIDNIIAENIAFKKGTQSRAAG